MVGIQIERTVRLTAAVIAAGALALGGVASADQTQAEDVIVGEEVTEVAVVACADCPAGNNGLISIAAGIDFADKYFFRGYLQQSNGFQTQPWAELGIQLVDEGNGPFQNVSLFVGSWNSLNSEKLGWANGSGTSGSQNWYESDLYAGIATSLGHGLSASVSYIAYTYPSNFGFLEGDGSTIGEIDLGINFDDSDLFGGNFSLSPYVVFAFQIHNGTGWSGKDAGYFEFGMEPSYTVAENSDYPISLSVPIALGVSLYEEYYGDNDLGYGSIGLSVGVPLSFIPAGYGDWSAYMGISGIWQSAPLRYLNANSQRGVAWQDNFSTGISLEY